MTDLEFRVDPALVDPSVNDIDTTDFSIYEDTPGDGSPEPATDITPADVEAALADPEGGDA